MGAKGSDDGGSVVCREVGHGEYTGRVCNTLSDRGRATHRGCNTFMQHMSKADNGAGESVFDLSLQGLQGEKMNDGSGPYRG